MSDNKLEYKTEAELEHDRDTVIHNMKVIWGIYTKDHIAMLECTGIDDDGCLVYTDDYEKLRDRCAKNIVMFEEMQDKLDNINEALKGRDI